MYESIGDKMWREEGQRAEREAQAAEEMREQEDEERYNQELYNKLCRDISNMVELIELAIINLYKRQ